MSSADPPLDSRLSNDDLAPTTPLQRTWTVWNIAALWVGMAVCIPTYTLASGLVAKGWSWQASVGAIALGNLVVLLPMVLNAHAGTRYGIPFPTLIPNVPEMLEVKRGWDLHERLGMGGLASTPTSVARHWPRWCARSSWTAALRVRACPSLGSNPSSSSASWSSGECKSPS